jgi:hypothetical protein
MNSHVFNVTRHGLSAQGKSLLNVTAAWFIRSHTVVEAHDVILAKITPHLHLDELDWNLVGVAEPTTLFIDLECYFG